MTVRVKSRVRCVKLRPAKAGEARLRFLREAIGRDFGTVKARNGRRIAPFWNAARGRARRVRGRVLRVLPKALAWAQARRGSARAAVRGDPTPCSSLTDGRDRGSFDGFSIAISGNGDLQMDVALQDGYAISVEIGRVIACSELDLPACPMPDGALDGTDGHQTRIGMRITRNGALVQSFTKTARSTTTLKGKVADDAKLDTLELQDVTNESMSFAIPGAQVTFRIAIVRTAVIDMRSGAPKPTPQVRVADFSFAGQSRAQANASVDDAARAYAQSFRDLWNEERDNARRRENLWQSAGTCAKVIFEPGADTLKLAKDATRQVTPRVEANAGGVAAKGKWTLSAPQNATFSPQTADGGSAPFSYTVTRAGPGIKVSAAFRATSTAGVAEGTWTQPTTLTINHLTGAFTHRVNFFGSVLEWAGNATFDRATPAIFGGAGGDFKLTGGLFTVTASGADRFVVGSTCSQRGSKQFALSTENRFTILGSGQEQLPPYDYSFSLSSEGQGPSPGGIPMMDITLFNCGANAAELEGQVFSHPVTFGMSTKTMYRSDDATLFEGSETGELTQGSFTQSWSFRGTE